MYCLKPPLDATRHNYYVWSSHKHAHTLILVQNTFYWPKALHSLFVFFNLVLIKCTYRGNIVYSWKFSPGENFRLFLPTSYSLANLYAMNFFTPIQSLKYSFQTRQHICFVMEFYNGGNLLFHIQRARKFNEDRTRFYGAEVTLAVGYLHELKIIYRGMKVQ